MISIIGFLLILGLLVFGPKKTIEIAQEVGQMMSRLKHAAGELQQAAMGGELSGQSSGDRPDTPAVPWGRQQNPEHGGENRGKPS